jgi:hypothetical protein
MIQVEPVEVTAPAKEPEAPEPVAVEAEAPERELEEVA